MTTRRTHLERFSLSYGGDEDKQDVHFESDPDLSVKLAKGDVFDGPGLSDSSGLVVVALDFDGGPYAEVKVDRHGTRVEDVEVLDQAIEHLEGLRDTRCATLSRPTTCRPSHATPSSWAATPRRRGCQRRTASPADLSTDAARALTSNTLDFTIHHARDRAAAPHGGGAAVFAGRCRPRGA